MSAPNAFASLEVWFLTGSQHLYGPETLKQVNADARRIAEAAGLTVVMDRCVKIEYARFFGGLNWMGVNTGVISARRPV